jgi:lysophospholipase L1-like esterase
LACTPLQQYNTENIVERYEDEIVRFEIADRTDTLPDNAVLFYGSASINLWESIEDDMAPYPVIQRGYRGAALHDAAYYAERVLTPHDYAALVLYIGNDILGNAGDKSPDEMAALFQEIIKVSKKHRPKAPIFFVEITHVPARADLVDQIDAANRRMQAVCKKPRRVYFIPTRDLYLDADNEVKSYLFRADRIHQNDEGYALWTERIKSVLRERLPTAR